MHMFLLLFDYGYPLNCKNRYDTICRSTILQQFFTLLFEKSTDKLFSLYIKSKLTLQVCILPKNVFASTAFLRHNELPQKAINR